MLYEAGYEKDRLNLVQASMLLSLENYIDFEVSDESQFWLDVCLINFEEWKGSQPDEEIWNSPSVRLRWSLYVVNNTMNFRRGKSGPGTFQSHEVGFPSLSRFDTLINAKQTLLNLKSSGLLRQPYLQKLLAEMFIHRLRLQRIISRITEEAAEIGLGRITTRESMEMEGSHCRLDLAKVFSKWDSELDKWWCGLPDYASDLKSAFHFDDSTSIRLLSFHLAVTATEFFSICNAIYSFLTEVEDSSSFWVISVKHKQSMNSAKLLHIISGMDERDMHRYLLNHGLNIVEWALQRRLSSSHLSTNSKDIAKVLSLTKKLLDIRTNLGRDNHSLTRFMKSTAQNLRTAEESPPKDTVINADQENSTDARIDSPCSALLSSTEASIPSETPSCYANMTEDLDPLFASCDGYTLVEDLMSPSIDVEWLKT